MGAYLKRTTLIGGFSDKSRSYCYVLRQTDEYTCEHIKQTENLILYRAVIHLFMNLNKMTN